MLAAAIAAVLLGCTFASAAPPPGKGGGGGGGGGGDTATYMLVDLQGFSGNPDGEFQSDATALSEPGETGTVLVVGASRIASDASHPALWTVQPDGTFTIEDIAIDGDQTGTRASDVNDLGVITVNQGYGPNGAWVLVPGRTPQDLGPTAKANAVNNFGEIVGWGTNMALWTLDADGLIEAETSLGEFNPSDISDAGVMAGKVPNSDGVYGIAAVAAFDEGQLHVQTLGVPEGFDVSEATAISRDGAWICGTASAIEVIDGDYYFLDEAFVWSQETGMILLGTLGGGSSVALGVNDAGKVVGWSEIAGGKYNRSGFLWESGRMVDLNKLHDAGSGVHLDLATGISDSGHVVGVAKFSRPSKGLKGVLLIPNG